MPTGPHQPRCLFYTSLRVSAIGRSTLNVRRRVLVLPAGSTLDFIQFGLRGVKF